MKYELEGRYSLEPLDKIMVNVDSAVSVIENLLSFSKSSERKEKIDIIKVMEDTLQLIEAEFPHQKIKLTKEFCEISVGFFGNVSQLQQAFLNIIQNSCSAMPEGGTLKIKIGVKTNSTLNIIISDNGLGIRKENLENIFAPFFTNKIEGVGLGLSISRQIIGDHNGTISVESIEGQGASFIINLPVNGEQQNVK